MKAVDFIKKFGWVVVQKGLENSKPHEEYMVGIYDSEPKEIDNVVHIDRTQCKANIDDLKRCVDAWELVQKHRGLRNAKQDVVDAKYLEMNMIFGTDLKALSQAITLVEEVENV